MMNRRNVVYKDCYGNQCIAGVSSAREIAVDIAGGLVASMCVDELDCPQIGVGDGYSDMPEDVWGIVVQGLSLFDVVPCAQKYTRQYMDYLWFDGPDIVSLSLDVRCMAEIRIENEAMLVKVARSVLANGELHEIGLCGLMC